jgi:hypothetical protein
MFGISKFHLYHSIFQKMYKISIKVLIKLSCSNIHIVYEEQTVGMTKFFNRVVQNNNNNKIKNLILDQLLSTTLYSAINLIHLFHVAPLYRKSGWGVSIQLYLSRNILAGDLYLRSFFEIFFFKINRPN